MTTLSRILITGASGFVGRTLLSQLRQVFPKVHLIGTTLTGASTRALAGADETIALDLLEFKVAGTLIRQTRPDAVVHLAAAAAVGASHDDPDGTWRINVDATRRLAEAILADAPQAILLHASSAEVYGLSFNAEAPVDENAPMRPANPYAASKAAADIVIGEMALRGLRAIRFRPLNHIGPGQTPRFAVAAFARQIARIEKGLQEPVLYTGVLDRWRDFLDVQDVCAAYVEAICQAEVLSTGTVFNLASGQLRSLRDVLDALLARTRSVIRVDETSLSSRPNDLRRTACSAAAARHALGWAPRVPWGQTLDTIVADWRSQVEHESAS